MSSGPGDDTAHLCYPYFVTFAMMVIKSVPQYSPMHLGPPSLCFTATVDPVGKMVYVCEYLYLYQHWAAS